MNIGKPIRIFTVEPLETPVENPGINLEPEVVTVDEPANEEVPDPA